MEGRLCENRPGECHVMMKAEMRIMLPQAKEHLGLEKLEEARKDPSPTGFRGRMALLIP